MARNSLHITPDTMTEWMASTGFLFPRNELELARFEKLYAEVEEDLSNSLVDPEIILGRKTRTNIISIDGKIEAQNQPKYKMVARKGDSNIPQHIMDRIKANQDKKKKDDHGTEKDKPA
ncbi:MAG: hypothetical protein JST75_03805 [Bacteroidetes bacterium]|nr:hypothetical protein [Bacteroidota bacterium]